MLPPSRVAHTSEKGRGERVYVSVREIVICKCYKWVLLLLNLNCSQTS